MARPRFAKIKKQVRVRVIGEGQVKIAGNNQKIKVKYQKLKKKKITKKITSPKRGVSNFIVH